MIFWPIPNISTVEPRYLELAYFEITAYPEVKIRSLF